MASVILAYSSSPDARAIIGMILTAVAVIAIARWIEVKAKWTRK
jgi:hypothetical protein